MVRGKTKDPHICLYCLRKISNAVLAYTVTNLNGQLVGRIHAYEHQHVTDEFAAKAFTVKTSAGVEVVPRRPKGSR